MEKKNNLKNIVIVVLVLLLGVSLVYIGCDKFMKGDKEPINSSNNEKDYSNNNQEEVKLNEEDVKKWLKENEKLVMYFTDFGNDFNYLTAKSQEYTNFLAWYLIFGSPDSEKSLPFPDGSQYTDEYSLSKENAERIINHFLRNDLKEDFSELIDFSKLTGYNEKYFHFYSDEKNYYVQVLATGLDPIYTCVLQNIKQNDKDEIVIRYGVLETYSENLDQDNYKMYRELVLEKTKDAYRILKSGEVK